jgi:hypothetical protein
MYFLKVVSGLKLKLKSLVEDLWLGVFKKTGQPRKLKKPMKN